MTSFILLQKCVNLIMYYLLLYIGRWSELDILSWLTGRRGWAWMFPNELYVTDVSMARRILDDNSTSYFSKAPVDAESPLSDSMLNDPQRRPDSRRTLQKCLSLPKINNNYVPMFQECTRHLINQWKSSNSTVDMTDACMRLALDIVGQTLLGGTFGACLHEENGNELTRCMLMITREKFTKNKFNGNKMDVYGKDEIKFIDDLVQDIWNNSEQTLDFDNTKLVLFAGSETTATTLALTLLTLAYRKDIQMMLREQLNNRSTTEIEQNESLTLFINEILRFWSIAPFINRRCTRDLLLQNKTGRTLFIPSNSDVNIFTWSIHRSATNYILADEFDITRRSLNKDCYLPFSRGSRMCPGKEFAIRELKVIVAVLLQCVEFEPVTVIPTSDTNKILAQQLFHIDWHHAVLHTQEHVYLKLRFLTSLD